MKIRILIKKFLCSFPFIFTLIFSSTHLAQAQTGTLKPTPQANNLLILSGGGSILQNAPRYYHNISLAHQLFATIPIKNYVTGGNESEMTLFEFEKVQIAANDENQQELITIDRIAVDESGLPKETATIPVGGYQGAASLSHLFKAFTELSITKNENSLSPVRPFIFYVTDHGSMDKTQEASVLLWNKAHLNEGMLRRMGQQAPADLPMVMVLDQCFGGNMLRALWDETGVPRKKSCGLAASAVNEVAYQGGGLMKNLNAYLQKWPSERKTFTYRDWYHLLTLNKKLKSTPTLSHHVYLTDYFDRKQQKLAQAAAPLCAQPLPLQPLAFLPPQVELKLQAMAQNLQQEITTQGPLNQELSIEALENKVSELRAKLDQASALETQYKIKTYSRHIRALLKKHFPHYAELKKLSEGINDEQKERRRNELDKKYDQLKKSLEIDVMFTARYRHYTPARFAIPAQTTEIAHIYRQFKKQTNAATKLYRQHVVQLAKKKQLQAIASIISTQDHLAANAVIELHECEEQPVFSL